MPVPGFGPELTATVKWFNPEKGFGFVALTDGSGDAFLHVNTLSPTGQTSVPPGATLVVRVGQGQKGRQVSQVVSIDSSTATAEAPRAGAPGGAMRGGIRGAGGPRRADATGPAVETHGVVKWYNAGKGFGFVAASDGGKDVFVHASVLQRAGLVDLAEGQPVIVGVVQGAKGPEASFIRTS